MKKQLVILAIVTILVTVGLSGCNQESNPLTSDKDKFIGTWKGRTTLDTIAFDPTNITLTFFSDNTYSMNSMSDTWELKDGKLILHGTNLLFETSMQVVYSYTFSNNNRMLTISNIAGNDTPTDYLVLTKQ
jgi:hypothetical protein